MKEVINQLAQKSTESLCRLAKIILKENYFKLGDEIFHQLLGTAIGTKFAPYNANLFLAVLEQKLFAEYKYHGYQV